MPIKVAVQCFASEFDAQTSKGDMKNVEGDESADGQPGKGGQGEREKQRGTDTVLL